VCEKIAAPRHGGENRGKGLVRHVWRWGHGYSAQSEAGIALSFLCFFQFTTFCNLIFIIWSVLVYLGKRRQNVNAYARVITPDTVM
jgi:hypothetical protein